MKGVYLIPIGLKAFNKDMGADVRDRAGSTAVAVQIKRAVVLVLAVVASDVQHNA